ncbi:MAG: SUMF1/EgtB/PvdO family nonheme iron enzyme [Prosthecobacter sp.]|uniref:bifunctional serine/threonine-protein kinase/formylglycine-generating enzyme family protein n=1 Tax=Prosthecobacter sp. TaxID=1965333 RepID=UPI001A098A5A|nr:bifunctional serine/threonine-protein kinase/formylglycine-generating enzyme family protein [Prosthecobacter sp.]MBE2285349.1 SUMF1/EgtB/PvdO family nonheme iron enzyme [Prosthecobacter sp.]
MRPPPEEPAKSKKAAVPLPEDLGPHFPNYEILRILGRGGMGAVYLARQTSLNRLVAIKILPAELDDGENNFTQRFKNEAQAMAQLSHPGIVAVYDFGQTTSGLLFIVMEYIDGTDVALMVTRQGRLPSAHAMAITAHVCDALAYAHGKGIIHRDIKPSNIMIGNDGVVKVADFGLAKMSQAASSGLTQSGMVMGTLHFMAPEALMLGSEVDQRADIYAVGVMLYQMLTGKLPQGLFEMPSLQVKGLDPRYDQIVAKALREDRDLRYPDANAMRHDLDAILTQPVVKAEAAPPAAPAAALPPAVQRVMHRPPPRQMPQTPSPRRSGFGVWAAVVIVGGLAAWYFLGQTKPQTVATVKSSETPSAPATAKAETSPAPVAPAASPQVAPKDAPFVNSLGMKFVPVPITGGPTNGRRVLFSVWVTRVRDFEAFAKAVSLPVPVNRKSLEAGPDGKLSWDVRGRYWQSPGFPQTPDHPVVTVSWEEANAFCDWLTQKERGEKTLPANHRYRLPSDHEWSCAAGIGELENPVAEPAAKHKKVADIFSWGTAWPPPPGSGNFAGIETSEKLGDTTFLTDYRDNYPWTSPVDAFAPGKFGLHDMSGNVSQWCADLFTAGKGLRVLRGAAWDYDKSDNLFLSARASLNPGAWTTMGFRVVLAEDDPAVSQPVLPTPKPASMIGASTATKEKPFENSLGMKFVPVPITGGPTDGQRVLFSIWETRVKDYEVFARETRCDWPEPPYPLEPTFPAVNMSWDEARAYCVWLTERERKAGWLRSDESYRLPSDHEWSCAVGIGELEDAFKPAADKHLKISDIYPWGTGYPPPLSAGNYNGEEAARRTFSTSFRPLKGYHDDYPGMAPVGTFTANKFGLYDLGGNAWELCDEENGKDAGRIIRGACFLNSPANELLSSMRGAPPTTTLDKDTRAKDKGFRVVLTTARRDAAPAAATPKPRVLTSPAPATDPSTNTLGMKFAPLPGTKVSMCIHETCRADYAAFASAVPSASPAWKSMAAADNHPVTNVSWEEATAFCAWLSKKENRRYRLPTDREWSIAVGIAAQESASAPPFKLNGAVAGVYPWSKAKIATVKAGNYAGAGDVYEQTAPVMSFPANELGLFDLGGNVWEYCADLFSPAAATRVLRGASWMDSDPAALLSSCRDPIDPTARSPFVGFRVVLEGAVIHPASSLVPSSSASTPSPAAPVPSSVQRQPATKSAPFINSLGMKFVSVPITGGPTDKNPLLFSIWPTRSKDYQAFITDTRRNWAAPNFQQTPEHPAVLVSWEDARAFCDWLTARERKSGILKAGQVYRLPTDHEWSCGVGIGDKEDASKPPMEKSGKISREFPWGKRWPPPDNAGNYTDRTAEKWQQQNKGSLFKDFITSLEDGYVQTSPVGSFPANTFGLYDMGGNVWNWCEDIYFPGRTERTMRGAAWFAWDEISLLSSNRIGRSPTAFYDTVGFRCVLDETASP